MKEPNDLQQDCIPPGPISGDNHGTRMVSLAIEFHELINNMLMLASDYWDSMSGEGQHDSFLQVCFDVRQDEYHMVDRSHAFTMSDVQSFLRNSSPGGSMFVPFVIVRSSWTLVCYCHTSAVGTQRQSCWPPWLQSVLDQKLCDEALEGDDSLDGLTFCEDSEQQDMICFNKSSEALKWLSYAPSSGVRPKPLPEKGR